MDRKRGFKSLLTHFAKAMEGYCHRKGGGSLKCCHIAFRMDVVFVPMVVYGRNFCPHAFADTGEWLLTGNIMQKVIPFCYICFMQQLSVALLKFLCTVRRERESADRRSIAKELDQGIGFSEKAGVA
ncbi:hypothetical protein CEXT_348891 [Caerostris extrusa]|uniref:Uncharacterized protein n=1 Tax=Caerostris extrusa TaxID=172846 RepID=A0AAV4XSS5_CAEEX|nr:hypothetical protein CEXT_348891 [Caerostris extrusa]